MDFEGFPYDSLGFLGFSEDVLWISKDSPMISLGSSWDYLGFLDFEGFPFDILKVFLGFSLDLLWMSNDFHMMSLGIFMFCMFHILYIVFAISVRLP